MVHYDLIPFTTQVILQAAQMDKAIFCLSSVSGSQRYAASTHGGSIQRLTAIDRQAWLKGLSINLESSPHMVNLLLSGWGTGVYRAEGK